MPDGGFEVEWLDSDPAAGSDPESPDRAMPDGATQRRRRPARPWTVDGAIAVAAVVAAAVVALGIVTAVNAMNARSNRQRADIPPAPEQSTSIVGFAPLVQCASLVGTTSWHDVLDGPGCTIDGKTIAQFTVTACRSGEQVWSIHTWGGGYWAASGVLFHQLSPDPNRDAAYQLARSQCARADPAQRLQLGSTALVDTFDGDLEVTVSPDRTPRHRAATAPATATAVTVRITCLYGKAALDSFSLGAFAAGTPSELLDPAQITMPVLRLTAGQSATGRAVFAPVSGQIPTVFWWGDDLNTPLVYWS